MLCIWYLLLVHPSSFSSSMCLLQMHARGTLELEKSAMHHHNYYIPHHDRRPLLIRPSYSIQVYCNSSTPCCTHTILRRKLYTLLGALVIGASRLSAFSESLALKSLWVNSSEQSHIIFSSLKQARARTKIVSGMSDHTHAICNLYPHTLPSSYICTSSHPAYLTFQILDVKYFFQYILSTSVLSALPHSRRPDII